MALGEEEERIAEVEMEESKGEEVWKESSEEPMGENKERNKSLSYRVMLNKTNSNNQEQQQREQQRQRQE